MLITFLFFFFGNFARDVFKVSRWVVFPIECLYCLCLNYTGQNEIKYLFAALAGSIVSIFVTPIVNGVIEYNNKNNC